MGLKLNKPDAESTPSPIEDDPLAAVLPQDAAPWYKQRHLLHLNFIIFFLMMYSSANGTSFLLARLFLGGASALFGNAVPLLINEIAYPTHRGILNGLFMSGWYVGGTVAAFVVFASRTYDSSWAWRLPSILQVLVPLVGLPGFLLAPESPRWLVSVGREDEARNILTQYHANGDSSSALVNYEFQEIISTIRAEQEANQNGSYLEMVKTPGNRHRLMISISLGLFAQWVGNGVISYYLSLILDSVGVTKVRDQTLISACLQVWDLLFAALAPTIVGMFFNTFVNPIAMAAISWKYYFVFVAVLLVFGATAFFYYPETKGYSLEQIAVLFDGDDALVRDPVEIAKGVRADKVDSLTEHEESI
ncbi:Major facilitator superfamily domain general substrate transporter [Penicillium macrosclerotiorum]|uniref:Major facilitator superfamily domain general substrate transporter n=1 Tax=Penicillium macrosclerotiorum TaxID=303699 RepID=UPI002549B5FE|nr:Major facilitator superfamily domain general substrate transporter [Penicillium macrosclerotiorum]KAJ5688900.1 Major facilitator superfamily domain general substrate transporter [Penicillium macrosclerotiorum]